MRSPRLDCPFEPTHFVGCAMNGDITIDGLPSTEIHIVIA
jgi:hypothetical protein